MQNPFFALPVQSSWSCVYSVPRRGSRIVSRFGIPNGARGRRQDLLWPVRDGDDLFLRPTQAADDEDGHGMPQRRVVTYVTEDQSNTVTEDQSNTGG